MTALRRAAASHLLVVIAILVVGAGIAGGALVGFSAEDQNASSTFAGGWVGAATGLAVPSPNGYGATLSWTPATHGLTDQALYGTDQGTTSNCTGATYATQFAASLGVATSSTTDSRGASANGHWICYQLRSLRSGTNWTNAANFNAVQVGLVGSTVVSANGTHATSGSIDSGDTITFSFNQNITYSGTSTITVCTFTSGVILIGTSPCTSATATPSIASITGLTIGSGKTFANSAVAASGSQLVVTIAGPGKASVAGSGSVTWTGSPSLVTSTSGGAAVCTAANCTWTHTNGF